MFEIREETKEEAVKAMLVVLLKNGITNPPDDMVLREAFDAASAVVMKQFGF